MHCQIIIQIRRANRRKIRIQGSTEEESTEETEPEEEAGEEASPIASYIIIGILAIAFIGGAYYFKVVRRKKEDFIEDEDEDEEDTEEMRMKMRSRRTAPIMISLTMTGKAMRRIPRNKEKQEEH